MRKILNIISLLLGHKAAEYAKKVLRKIGFIPPFLSRVLFFVNPIKVSFIIVGAQKSGTTALYHFIKQHPTVSLSFIKETNFFWDQKNWINGTHYKAYKKYFYGNLFKKLYGESSPSYMMCHETVAPRISNYNAEMKLIFILKNPVDRVYSQHKMYVKKYNLNLSFEECLDIAFKQPEERIVLDPITGFSTNGIKSYLRVGHYSEQIRTYQKYFKPSQFLFLLTEDLLNEHEETMKKVFHFLELSPIHTENKIIHSNKGEIISNESRRRLLNEYYSDICELEILLKRDLSHWKKF